jgi:hypothetical protein
MKLCCRVNGIPPRPRVVLGAVLIAAGMPLTLLPLPAGIVLFGPGLFLLASGSETCRRWLRGLEDRLPFLYRWIRPFAESCSDCPPPPPR